MRRRTSPSIVAATALVALASSCGGPPPASPTAAPGIGPSASASATARPAGSAPGAVASASASASASAAAMVPPVLGALGSLISRRFGNAGPRPSIVPREFRVDDLPNGTIPDALTGKDPPPALPGEAATDLWFKPTPGEVSDDRSVLVGAKDAPFGWVRMGPWAGWTGGAFGPSSGAYVRCGRQGGVAQPLLPARWETLRIDKTRADLVVSDGWFDRTGCKTHVVRRTLVEAKPLVAGGLIYGARVCMPTCPDRPALLLLMPRTQTLVATGVGGDATKDAGAYTRVALPMRRGGGGSMLAQIQSTDIASWRAVRKDDADPARPSGLLQFGIEVVQGVDDERPIAVEFEEISPTR